MKPSFSFLSRLWLREPDSETLALAKEFDAFGDLAAKPEELAPAYIDLFLLNVYPYGSAFTDPSGELNGRSAGGVAKRFEEASYNPPELSQVGSPDHTGLCLGFLGHLEKAGETDRDFLWRFAFWLPVCALAVERERSAHPFYRSLASATRETVFASLVLPAPVAIPPELEDSEPEVPESEVWLSDVIRFLLAPARCGFFLSRSRLAEIGRAAGLLLPFSARFDLARTLFVAAGESGSASRLLELLLEEASSWESAYRELARQQPAWQGCAEIWVARLQGARRRFKEMHRALDSLGQLGYEGEGQGDGIAPPGPVSPGS